MREFIWRPQGKIPATLTGIETFTNKTIISPTVSGGTFVKPTVSGGTQTSPTLVNARFNTGISTSGSGVKHKRVTVTAIAATTTATFTFTWASPFGDLNYTPVVSVFSTSLGVTATTLNTVIITKIAGSMKVLVKNTSSAGLGQVTAHAFAVHD